MPLLFASPLLFKRSCARAVVCAQYKQGTGFIVYLGMRSVRAPQEAAIGLCAFLCGSFSTLALARSASPSPLLSSGNGKRWE